MFLGPWHVQDLDRAEAVVKDMKAFLDRSIGVDSKLPLFVGVASLDSFSINIRVLVMITNRYCLSDQNSNIWTNQAMAIC